MSDPSDDVSRRAVVGPVLYIAGSGRSGSTVLECVLGSHPDVATLGEVHHLWERGIAKDELCGCGERFSQCPFWTEVGARAFGGWDAVDLSEVGRLHDAVDRHRRMLRVLGPVRGGELRRSIRAYSDLYADIYQAAAEVSGARLVVDSGKHATLAASLTQNQRLDLRILHLVRDATAVAYSWSREVERPEAQTEEDSLMTQYSSSLSSALWGLTNIEVEALRLRGARPVRLRYEDLVADPGPSLTKSLIALGLRSFDPHVDGEVQLRRQHTVAGNPMRFSKGALRLRRDDAWRTSMSSQHRRIVKVLTAPLRLGYGYTS